MCESSETNNMDVKTESGDAIKVLNHDQGNIINTNSWKPYPVTLISEVTPYFIVLQCNIWYDNNIMYVIKMTLHCNFFSLTTSVAKDRRNVTPLITKKITDIFSKNRHFLKETLQTGCLFFYQIFDIKTLSRL